MNHIFETPLLPALILSLGFGACASAQPPAMLVDARASYQRSQTGRAGEVAPAELYESKKSLAQAERAFADNGDSWETRSYAYIALRKSERAQIIAEERDLAATLERREESKDELAERMRREATRQLGNARADLEDEKAARARAESGRLAAEAAKLRADAETAAAKAKLEAMTRKLQQIAQVAESERGLVISLASGVLFNSGSVQLRAVALPKLDLIAEVLAEQPAREVTIEGHTDSNGSDATNMILSMNRAQSVRNYLMSRGIAGSRLVAIGLGESRPVTENGTVEGRATNRRVEIVLAPLPKSVVTP